MLYLSGNNHLFIAIDEINLKLTSQIIQESRTRCLENIEEKAVTLVTDKLKCYVGGGIKIFAFGLQVNSFEPSLTATA